MSTLVEYLQNHAQCHLSRNSRRPCKPCGGRWRRHDGAYSAAGISLRDGIAPAPSQRPGGADHRRSGRRTGDAWPDGSGACSTCRHSRVRSRRCHQHPVKARSAASDARLRRPRAWAACGHNGSARRKPGPPPVFENVVTTPATQPRAPARRFSGPACRRPACRAMWSGLPVGGSDSLAPYPRPCCGPRQAQHCFRHVRQRI